MKKRILTVLLAVLVLLCVPALAEGETEDPVLQELAGTWEGTGNPDGGGSPIQLSVILNPDGTGSFRGWSSSVRDALRCFWCSCEIPPKILNFRKYVTFFECC